MRLSNLFEDAATAKPPSDAQWAAAVRKNSFTAARKLEAMMQAGYQPGEQTMLAFVRAYGGHLRLFPSASTAVRIAAVQQSPEAIQWIAHPSAEEQLAAIQRDPTVIRLIKGEIAPEAATAAVAQAGHLIRYVRNPDCRMQTLAARSQFDALANIDTPCEEAQIASVETYGPEVMKLFAASLTSAAAAAGLRAKPRLTCQMFDDLSPEMQRIAFAAEPLSIQQMRKYPSFDPALEVEFQRWKHRRDRQNQLPLMGKGPVTTGLNQDQLKLLRWMDLHDRNSITVRDLKSQPWGNTSYFTDLIRATNGRDITRADVTSAAAPTVSEGSMDLLGRAELTVEPWTGAQIIFHAPNKAAVFSAKGSDLAMLNLTDEEKAKLEAVRDAAGGHPKKGYRPHHAAGGPLHLGDMLRGRAGTFSPGRDYTVGWVRYTLFGEDVWIDEVQSDLTNPQLLSPESMAPIRDIADAILLEFIRRMRRRGANRFFMPTLDMKKDPALYAANPPARIYKDLPKKMRFRMGTADGIDPKVDGQPVWVMEGARGRQKRL